MISCQKNKYVRRRVMKKVFAFVTLAAISLSLLCGCDNGEAERAALAARREAYALAVSQLESTQVSCDGTNVNEALLQAIENAEFTAPKNYIFMIGDGMGFNHVAATQEEYADELYEGKMAMNHLPVQGESITDSLDGLTDSAAGGTALSTGHKTSNGTVAMNKHATIPYMTTLERAAQLGKSTGIVATKSVTDATPASFTAHVQTRTMNDEIASQQIAKLMNGSLDLVLGGGSMYYEGSFNEYALKEAIGEGLTYTKSWEDAQKASLPLAGLVAADAFGADYPVSVAQMTKLALDLLSEDEDGFFLMIEGSQIDSASHSNNLDYMKQEAYSFDIAVSIAMRYVALHPDTVLIITADHETGGLVDTPFHFTSGSHSPVNVPVYAVGYRTQELLGEHENTDLANLVFSLMNDNQ